VSRGYLRPIFQNVMICYFDIRDLGRSASQRCAVVRRRNYVRRGIAQLRNVPWELRIHVNALSSTADVETSKRAPGTPPETPPAIKHRATPTTKVDYLLLARGLRPCYL